MNRFSKLAMCCLVAVNATNVMAQVNAAIKRGQSDACISSAECKQYRPKGNAADSVMQHAKGHRLSVGGYGEVAYSRNFFSDHVSRYSQPEEHKDDPSHGRFDIPNAVIFCYHRFILSILCKFFD